MFLNTHVDQVMYGWIVEGMKFHSFVVLIVVMYFHCCALCNGERARFDLIVTAESQPLPGLWSLITGVTAESQPLPRLRV